MERYLQLACCLYFLSYELAAFPLFSSQSSSYNTASSDVSNLCHGLAVSRLLDDDSYPALTDLLLSLHSEINNMEENQSNGYSDKRYELRNNLMDEKGIEAISDKVEELRKACLILYSSADIHSTKRTKKDPENFQLIESDNFSDGGLKELLSRGNPSESQKRNSDLALNPTGWRKRRSGRNSETESMELLLRNMREMLEKRERLQFNPTGW